MAESWVGVEIVWIPIVCCPYCHRPGYDRKRTEKAGDGSYSKKVYCLNCKKRYRIVFELPEDALPEPGSDGMDGGTN